MNEKLIRIANDWAIVRREKQLTDIARKIEAYLIWKVEFDSGDLPEVTINTDILMRCGLTRHDLDSKIQEVAEELLTYVIHYIQPDGDWGKTTLCSNFRKSGDNYIVRMDKALEPFFLELKKNFAQLSIHPLLALGRSSYSHHLYQYLRTKIHAGNFRAWCRIKIEDLKGLLGCLGGYEKWYEFKRWVLNPAIKEISEETDIWVTYKAESGPKGKAKKSIVFEIHQQEYQGILFDLNDNPLDYRTEPLPTEIMDICHKLTFRPIGKSEDLLRNALEKHSAEVLLCALNNIQEDWKEADDATRGGIVHRVLSSYLRRAKIEVARKADLEEKLQDRDMAEAALMAEKSKFDRLAKEYAKDHREKLYNSLDEINKSFYSLDSCPAALLEGLALDLIREGKN